VIVCGSLRKVHPRWREGGARPEPALLVRQGIGFVHLPVPWDMPEAQHLQAFRRAVLRLFVRLKLFDEEQAAGVLTWPHSGFHVHTAVWEGSFGCPRKIARSRRGSPGTARGTPSRWSGSPLTAERPR